MSMSCKSTSQGNRKEVAGITPVDVLTARRLKLSGRFDRESLEAAQLAALRHLVDYARERSPYYREKLADVEAEGLRSLSHLAGLPTTSSDDIIEEGHRMLCVSQSKVARVVTMQTSGSTGQPKRFYFTESDLETTVEFFFHGMQSLISMNDRVLVLLPFSLPDSVGDLLIRALDGSGIAAHGLWPPDSAAVVSGMVFSLGITCIVGLPQHLLLISGAIGKGRLKSMLLCSDYAPLVLRRRLERLCDCESFLHYGATESGLGGAVECSKHEGCHIRESDLLVEIIDPRTHCLLPDGEPGEVVITTLGREAMPLIRYRTGDTASLERSACECGGLTARLTDIRGRLTGCRLSGGSLLSNQEVDDVLFAVDGLLDYRLTLVREETDCLLVDYIADEPSNRIEAEIGQGLKMIPAIRQGLAGGFVKIGVVRKVSGFAATHTVKRTILDQR